MYCSVCGNKLEDGAVFCSKCGRELNNNQELKRNNNVAVIGFIFSFIVGLIGLICSIIGYRNADTLYGGQCKRLALAGIMVSEITITWQITFASIMATLFLIIYG